jgi:hypothetical protein
MYSTESGRKQNSRKSIVRVYEFGTNKTKRQTKKVGKVRWGKMEDKLVQKYGRKKYITNRNGRSSCER